MLSQEYLDPPAADALHVHSKTDAAQMASDIRKVLWGESQQPPDDAAILITEDVRNPFPLVVAPVVRIDEIVITTLGIPSRIFHYHPSTPNGAAIIVHEGHAKHFGRDGLLTLTNALLEEGYHVFTMEMPLYGNNGTARTRASHNTLILALEESGQQPLRIFLEPVWRLTEHISQTQSGVAIGMVGFSGGGWTTHLSAAIDERIAISIPVAGSLPLHLRTKPCLTPAEYGDLEQRKKDFYDKFSYLDLYVLATTSARTQIQVLNQFDTCCFSGMKFTTYESLIASAAQLHGGLFDVHLDRTAARHWVSTTAISSVVLPQLRKALLQNAAKR